MRTTHSMMANSFLRNLYNNNAKLNRYQNQLSSGDRILRASDDPIGTVRSIQTRKSISLKEDFKKSVQEAQDMLTQAETCLSEANSIIQRVKELSVLGNSDIYQQGQRDATAAEVEQLRDELVDIGNASVSGKYIFAGYNTTKAPFSVENETLLFNGVDMSASGGDLEDEASQVIRYQVDASTSFEVTMNGVEYMGVGENSLYQILTDIANTLRDENCKASDMSPYVDKMQQAFDRNMAAITDIGGRQTRLQLMESRYDDDLLNLEEKRSNIEDIEEAEVITKYKFAYAAYEESLAVGAQIIQPSLLDYLR